MGHRPRSRPLNQLLNEEGTRRGWCGRRDGGNPVLDGPGVGITGFNTWPGCWPRRGPPPLVLQVSPPEYLRYLPQHDQLAGNASRIPCRPQWPGLADSHDRALRGDRYRPGRRHRCCILDLRCGPAAQGVRPTAAQAPKLNHGSTMERRCDIYATNVRFMPRARR